MNPLSSLTNRIFLASTVLAVLAIAFAIYFVNVRVTAEAERELQRGLDEAATLLDQHRVTLVETYTLLARTIADLPKLKAAVATDDSPTVYPVAEEYQRQLKAALLVVTNRAGRVLAATGRQPPHQDVADGGWPGAERALAGEEVSGFWPHPNGVLQIVSVPIYIGLEPPDLLGALSVGFLLDNELAGQFRNLTDSEIAIAMDGAVRVATLPDRDRPVLAGLLGARSMIRTRIDGDDYVALARPFGTADAQLTSSPTVVILRSRTERLRFLSAIHTALAGTALLAVLVGTVLSYAVARTITRPLGAITAGMREMAATGDLTRKITLHPPDEWDEDARLLATTFNRLTDSIARFQREAAERERLSSLGRLSTVVAHEIRNPLMIIKGALRDLKRTEASREELGEAVSDIEEEVARLNRVVNDVLDFARPVRFDYRECDLNRLCRESMGAVAADDAQVITQLDPDPHLPLVVTDPERLRIALINVLANARHAVTARRGVAARVRERDSSPGVALAEDGDVVVSTRRVTPGRVAITVRDRGVGIEAQDASRIFDPYFTTKRGGTGLGLPIARNIVEGLGGTITVVSSPNDGAEIRMELPLDPRPSTPFPADSPGSDRT
jgi:signal transduction histidine kinase